MQQYFDVIGSKSPTYDANQKLPKNTCVKFTKAKEDKMSSNKKCIENINVNDWVIM